MNPFETSEVYTEPAAAAPSRRKAQAVSFMPEDFDSDHGSGDEPAKEDGFGDLPDGLNRKDSRVQRGRWGTQRNPKGRPKRQVSIFRHKSQRTPSGQKQERAHEEDATPVDRQIFFNSDLPPNLQDPETGLPTQDFPRNKIRTTKYTPLSFVPKNLYLQFRNVANIYFLFIAILGAFPIFGVQNPGLAAVPLVVIVCITAVKDAVEDYRRTLLDLEINNMRTQVLNVHNSNVSEEKISVWRRIKKGTSHAMMRATDYFSKKKAAKKGTKFTPRYTENLDDAGSVFSADYPLDDLASEEQGQNHQSQGCLIDTSIAAPPNTKFASQYWKNVKIGDLVRIRNDEEIPADVMILSTSEDDGACYVETKNLDGETNLKVRQALRCGQGIKRAQDAARASFWVESEGPMANLYQYRGVVKWDHKGLTQAEPASINNVLLRGCTLRNTDWVIGAVIYTGMDTKIMINSGITPTKRSFIQRSMNRYVIYNFILLFVLCFASGLINGIKHHLDDNSSKVFDFDNNTSPVVDGIVTFWAGVILYQSLVPISLYISIEIVKTWQAFFIYSDVYMYYEKLDYPCTPKSWNISDDLGQIEYVFSDKTGTLTQNIMEFRKCTINGVAYGKAYTEAMAGLDKRAGIDVEEKSRQMQFEISQDKKNMIERLRGMGDNPYLIPDRVQFVSYDYVADMDGASGKEQADANYHFMLCLSICNSVITESSKDIAGHKDFKAQSPDEAALVSAARDVGFALEGRTRRGVLVSVQGKEQEFQVLNILEFNSTRKRMSAIVKIDDRILLICKGADSIIYERLTAGAQQQLREKTAVQLEEFANEGLRTLCIAERELTPQTYAKWNEAHQQAAAAVSNREEKLEEVADSIERELTLLGGTAIEDRLQDGVPSTISLLADGGIKLWVLTGDKVETAINIGFSCNLLTNDMRLLVVKVENNDEASVAAQIDEYLQKYFHIQGTLEDLEKARLEHNVPESTHAVVIDGDALKLALHPAIQHKFLLLCKQCSSVLCCRVSPAQKAAVVRMVRTNLGVITLSIGDGANDVAMIQEADIGVGIAGEEGRQAVMSSDYGIGQFRYLARLVLVHGRWDYKRLAEMIPNFFYKNVVFTLTLFWYGCFNDFDMSYLYDYTIVMFFNLAFTSLPVILMGIFDQDVPDKISLAVPQLYRRGIQRLDFNEAKFWLYMLEGMFQSFVAFFFPYFVWSPGRFESMHGSPANHRFWIGVASSTIAVFANNAYVISNMYQWDWITVVVVCVSCLLTFCWTGIYTSFVASSEFYQAGAEVYGMLNFWAVLLLGFTVCMMPHVSILYARITAKPLDVEIIREQWKLGEFDEILSQPQAADDPDLGDFSSPYRPQGGLKGGMKLGNFTKHNGGGRLKRFSRMGKRQSSPYQIENESHTDILRSPDVVRVGSKNVFAEEHSWSKDIADNHSDLLNLNDQFAPGGHHRRDSGGLEEHRPADWARKSLSNDARRSLDIARDTARFEQAPGTRMEYYTTQDVDGAISAEGIMRHNPPPRPPRSPEQGFPKDLEPRSPFEDQI